MPNFAQTKRFLKLKTPLGADEVLLAGFSGFECFSRLFEFELDLASLTADIDPAQIVGQEMSWTIDSPSGGTSHFAGIVRRFAAGGSDPQGFRRYSATIVPKMWLLTRRTSCRIFQGKTVTEIISMILDELGVSDTDISQLMGTYEPLEFCVQYRESDFDFVSRLMEEFGIFYFFRFEEGKHTLFLADDIAAYQACDPEELPFHEGNMIGHRVTSWQHSYELTSGAVAFRDYDFVKPAADLQVGHPTLLKIPSADLELYDYPGRYVENSTGDGLAKAKMEAEEARFDVVEGSSTCPTLISAGTFKLSSSHGYEGEAGVGRVLVRLSHSATDTSHHQGSGDQTYSNSFTCLPSDVVARPARTTARPRVQGPQTALVTGPSGEEIHTDEYGRIKVKFHWDRSDAKDDNSSCWVRVSQSWAGKKWGAQFIPRVGQEVIVEFLDGDPDRPIVTGCVYNGDQMPTYDLPANKTQSGTKSRSSKEAGASNFNELRFEDKKGNEMLSIQAEKDLERLVKNNESDEVGNDRERKVGQNETIQIGKNRTLQVGDNQETTIGTDLTTTIGNDESASVGANQTLTVGKDRTRSVSGEETISVTKDQTISIEGGRSMSIAKDKAEAVGGASSVSVDKEFTLDAKKIMMEAKDEVSIKVGKASLVMKKNGDITLNGKKITIKGSGDVVIKGSKIAQN